MRQRVLAAIVLTTAILALASLAPAGVPQMINYQGQLTNSSGDPLDTTVSMEFAIYDDSTGGVVLWMETHPSVTVTGGMFSVMLGSAAPIVDDIFSDDERYLGITVGGDPELTPRTRFVSVSYSHRISTVDGATGGIISGDVDIQSDLTVSGKATIGTGHTNSGDFAFVAGKNNSADLNADYAAIGGGRSNSCSGGESATVGGGLSNQAGNVYTTVGGGNSNAATAGSSTVGGGYSNTAGGGASTISGGKDNIANGQMSAVGGGESNAASGSYSTVPGGYDNSASASYTFAAGRRAKATHDGAFVWADHTNADYSSTASDQFLIRAAGGVGIGTNSPATELDVDGAVTATTFYGDGSNLTGVGGSDADWTIDGDDVYHETGNVGVGTTTPNGPVHVQNTMSIANADHYVNREAPLVVGDGDGSNACLLIDGNQIEQATGDKLNINTTSAENVVMVNGGGRVGIGTTNPQGILDVSSTTGAFIVPRMTTTERDALTAVNGMIIYNTSTNQFNFYENGAWVTK